MKFVYSLCVEGTALRPAFPEPRFPENCVRIASVCGQRHGDQLRRRVLGGQIRTNRKSGSIEASRAKPMGRIRLRRQRKAVNITEIIAVTTGEP
jgi:hypothetical protein